MKTIAERIDALLFELGVLGPIAYELDELAASAGLLAEILASHRGRFRYQVELGSFGFETFVVRVARFDTELSAPMRSTCGRQKSLMEALLEAAESLAQDGMSEGQT